MFRGHIHFADRQIAGIFDTYADAIKEGYAKFGLEPFLVKQIQAVERIQFVSRFVDPCHISPPDRAKWPNSSGACGRQPSQTSLMQAGQAVPSNHKASLLSSIQEPAAPVLIP
jgi:hypothetical protein